MIKDVKRERNGLKRLNNEGRIKRAVRLGEVSKKVSRENLRVNREFASIEQAPNG